MSVTYLLTRAQINKGNLYIYIYFFFEKNCCRVILFRLKRATKSRGGV
jgi:hypothetical protein